MTTATATRSRAEPENRLARWTNEWLPVAKLERDMEINRELDCVRAKKMADQFDPDIFGTITISRRKDGRLVIIDGQHRVQCIMELDWKDQNVPCKVYEGLSKAQEAKLFIGLNSFKAVQYIDRFLVRVTGKDPTACAIVAIVQKAGYAMSRKVKDGTIVAARAMENVYTGRNQRIRGDNPRALESTIGVVTLAWGRTSEAVNGQVIEGVGAFFLRYGDAVDKGRVVECLSATKGGAMGLVRAGKGKQDIHGGSISAGIGCYLVEQYNKAMRGSKRLPGWWHGQDEG